MTKMQQVERRVDEVTALRLLAKTNRLQTLAAREEALNLEMQLILRERSTLEAERNAMAKAQIEDVPGARIVLDEGPNFGLITTAEGKPVMVEVNAEPVSTDVLPADAAAVPAANTASP